MAKKPKVPLNVLVAQGTRTAVKALAESLECSQGEVVDRALVLLAANEGVAKGLAGVSVPPRVYTEPAARHLVVELDGEGE